MKSDKIRNNYLQKWYKNIKKPVQETIKDYIDKSLSPNFELICAMGMLFFSRIPKAFCYADL